MPGPKPKDITDQRFGHLVATRFIKTDGHNRQWEFHCDCGTSIICYTNNVTSSTTRSCGCWQRKVASDNHTRHGMHNTPTYQTWRAILKRCYNPLHDSYEYYGGRGIKVCDRWRNSFQNFYDDMGLKPSSKHSIDRYPNNNGDYEPRNCRWATSSQQQKNKQR